MINKSESKSTGTKISNLERKLKEVNIVFLATVKKLEKLHLEKMKLIKQYREAGQAEEINKIRRSLKNL
jgi:hypothetical protein